MKKVGILSLYYNTYNYGAQLQAYALQKVIEKLGYDCEQISFRWSNVQTEWNYLYNFSIDRDAFEEFSHSIPHSDRVYDPESIRESVGKYDIFVCGSDQIWGVNYSMPTYVVSQMALGFVPNNRVKIAYAASFGGSMTSPYIMEALKDAISSLDAISMRERSACESIRKITSKRVTAVLDPVMLLKTDEWNQIAANIEKEGKYVLVYDIGKMHDLEKFAEELAQKNDCKIVNLSYFEGKKVGPKEFVGLFKNAEFVLTDSFHGTVLSILYHKQFMSFSVDHIYSLYSKNMRLEELLKSFGLESRFIYDSSHISIDLMEEKINYEEVEQYIAELRKCSYDYLKKNLAMDKAEKVSVSGIQECCGCGTCELICPYHCISMQKDKLGFAYPQIDKNNCTNCGKCKDKCPVLHKKNIEVQDIETYAIKAKENDIRWNSSSGGAFAVFANKIIEENGVVFGAKYTDSLEVCHDYGKNKDDILWFTGSKYVQSTLNDSFFKAEKFLEEGKKVLFSGTPCQIAGLQNYLDRDYSNLFTVDFICGGVTSPALWNKYLSHYSNIRSVNMRNKDKGFLNENGYPNFAMEVIFDNGEEVIIPKEEDYFLSARFNFYRESCYNCKFKGERHGSDLTLGDFCGMNILDAKEEDGKGVSLAIIQSERGKVLFEKCINEIEYKRYPIDKVKGYNPMLSENMKKRPEYEYMRTILEESSVEKIFYETKLWNIFQQNELLLRNYYVEIKRNEMLLKTIKYQKYGLLLEYDPIIKGEIIIYGAGKIGRELLLCTQKGVKGFIDCLQGLKSCNGVKVYHLEDEEITDLFSEEVTVIVTPVWEFGDIKEKLLKFNPFARVISLEYVVEKICI